MTICPQTYDRGRWACTLAAGHKGDCTLQRLSKPRVPPPPEPEPEPEQPPPRPKRRGPRLKQMVPLGTDQSLPTGSRERGVVQEYDFWEWPVVQQGTKWITKRDVDGMICEVTPGETSYRAQLVWRVIKIQP